MVRENPWKNAMMVTGLTLMVVTQIANYNVAMELLKVMNNAMMGIPKMEMDATRIARKSVEMEE